MFRIGEFSKLSRTTVKTLRYYDEIGLLKPEATDPQSGYRLYTTDVYKRQAEPLPEPGGCKPPGGRRRGVGILGPPDQFRCLLYTSRCV